MVLVGVDLQRTRESTLSFCKEDLPNLHEVPNGCWMS